jgi:hypothetical protein
MPPNLHQPDTENTWCGMVKMMGLSIPRYEKHEASLRFIRRAGYPQKERITRRIPSPATPQSLN